MLDQKRVELLSPAGNIEGFYGAVHGGADAVYLGGSRFGARAYAENLTDQELIECIRYGHLLGRKIYLTVNTLLKEEELSELYGYLNPFYEAGLDAVIVQDMGVLGFIREHFPGMELHASTQMTLCSHHGAELLKELGVSRIVPARELSLEELSEIRDRVDVELETFIHGAMCYCYSGQCLFSSVLGGRSGNRGRCAQPCRLPYQVGTGRKQSDVCYPMSLKDMCTIEHLPRLIEAGIDSLKIEGRMKKPEYAAGVTAVYRRYIDRYYELRERFGKEQAAEFYRVAREDRDILSGLYIRSEKQDGYYFKHNGRDMVTLSSPAYSGSDEKLLEKIRTRYLEERLKLPVKVDASFVTGQPAEVTLQAGELSVTIQGSPVDRAQKQPITEENVRKQLGKMGDSAFVPEQMELNVGEDAFYPLKQINELRREAVLKLELAILEKNGYGGRRCGDLASKKAPQRIVKGSQREERQSDAAASAAEVKASVEETPGIAVSVRTLEQLRSVADHITDHPKKRFKRLYLDGDLLLEQTGEIVSFCEKLRDITEFYIALPYILRRKDDIYLGTLSGLMDRYPLFCGVLARSLDGLAYARGKGYPVRLDAGVYCWNSMALEELLPVAEGFCMPFELKSGEQRKLLEACEKISGGQKFEKIVYGRIPMMITANCLSKTTESCRPQDREAVVLTDRYRKEFPVVKNCRHCMNIIYNSVPLSLHQTAGEWLEKTDIRLELTLETGGEARRVLEAFWGGGAPPCGEYTTGHDRRGVE
ncbi:MAG: U32 family peptidase [Lachnospiraceae bacterium]|nr:U32 family peptidase [Lachnospiraceae bacterium]MCM1239114.1 U32 family peptidase [Lachnospiraceae bacterium]